MNKALAGLCLWLVAVCGPVSALAGGIDMALSNRTANIALLLNPYQFNQGGGSELGVGGFISEAGDNVLHATLMARGIRQTTSSQYNLGAGIKALAGDIKYHGGEVDEDSESVSALALGFQAGLLLASHRHNPVELTFEGFMAPSITSFGDATRYTELGARLQIEVIPQARAYIGYRRMNFQTNDYDTIGLDRGIHLGLKLTF